jgi:hypothetical protein
VRRHTISSQPGILHVEGSMTFATRAVRRKAREDYYPSAESHQALSILSDLWSAVYLHRQTTSHSVMPGASMNTDRSRRLEITLRNTGPKSRLMPCHVLSGTLSPCADVWEKDFSGSILFVSFKMTSGIKQGRSPGCMKYTEGLC